MFYLLQIFCILDDTLQTFAYVKDNKKLDHFFICDFPHSIFLLSSWYNGDGECRIVGNYGGSVATGLDPG